jgi:hypothetical protein
MYTYIHTYIHTYIWQVTGWVDAGKEQFNKDVKVVPDVVK